MSIKHEPRLEVLMSWWGMNGLGMTNGAGDEWSMEEKVRRIAEAGYNGINGMLPEGEEAEHWHQLLEQYNLSYCVYAYPKTAEDLDDVPEIKCRYDLRINSQGNGFKGGK